MKVVPPVPASDKAAPHFAQIVSEADSDAPHRGHVTDSVMRDVTTLAGRAGVSDTDPAYGRAVVRMTVPTVQGSRYGSPLNEGGVPYI